MDSANVPMPPEIRQFLESLLDEAQVTPDSDELKEMMLEDLYQRLQTRILQVLAEHLEAEDLETYTTLVEQDQAKAAEFLQAKRNDLPELMLQAMAEFRKTFLGQ